jgi:single-strand DNA-binding protein
VYTTDVVAERVEFLEWGESETEKKTAPKSEKPTKIPEGFQALEDDDDIPF